MSKRGVPTRPHRAMSQLRTRTHALFSTIITCRAPEPRTVRLSKSTYAAPSTWKQSSCSVRLSSTTPGLAA